MYYIYIYIYYIYICHINWLAGFQPSMNGMTGMTHPNTQNILDILEPRNSDSWANSYTCETTGSYCGRGCCPKVASNDPWKILVVRDEHIWNAPPDHRIPIVERKFLTPDFHVAMRKKHLKCTYKVGPYYFSKTIRKRLLQNAPGVKN